MLQLVNFTRSKLALKSAQQFSGGHHHNKVEGRIKVNDKIVWINVVPPDGIPRRIAGFENESLLEVINRGHVPGIYNECDGGDNELKPHQVPIDFYTSGAQCGQCQVVVADPWFDKLNKVLDFEDNRLLRTLTNTATNSRLACCVRVTPALNEMIVVIGNNRQGSGEFFTGTDPAAF
ncbi:ferredoxin [Stylonychia lemnae]|uniref:Ferredoxin n=1 Tax=Stylonychia lemnae TaxID=5949 RepID=A0A078AX42_STYLE|nr:ferredoxin [Stylonychia lemnae]|eukprot:CDW86631.1 ferredoxin [Stylonychia lemnae]